MKSKELEAFLNKYGLEVDEFADLLGLTPDAVDHWIKDRRSIAKPYARLIKLFDRHPKLMREFNT